MIDATSAHATFSQVDGDTQTVVATPLSQLPVGYELGEFIARGGMGEVYRGRDLGLNREVAIKILQDRFAPTSITARRFVEEAQITGQLQHPGIPPIHHVGTWVDGRPFLAMKLIKGKTLADILKESGEVNLVAVFEAISQAVGYAHAHDVIHRDLKPANVMVGSFGEVQVMDWGLAKVLTSGPKPTEEHTDPNATRTVHTEIHSSREDSDETQDGEILGTPAYMPPEQAIGAIEEIDRRSDVFGLGAILCGILTGQPPYLGESAKTTRQLAAMAKLDTAFARLDASQADPELVALCKRCLSAEKALRPKDAREVASEVERLRKESEERAKQAEIAQAAAEVRTEEQRKRRRQFNRAASIVAVLLLIGIAGTTFGLLQARQAEQRESERADGEAKAKDDAVQARNDSEADKKRAIAFRDKALNALRATTGDDVKLLIGSKKELGANEKAYLEAIAKRWQTFAEQEGDDAESQALRAEAHGNVAGLWHNLGRQAEAQPKYEQSIVVLEKLVAEWPDWAGYRHSLAVILANYGQTLVDLGKYPEGESLYHKSISIIEKLVIDYPEERDYLAFYAACESNLGLLLTKLGKNAEGEERYRKSISISKKLASDFPAVHDYLSNLSASRTNLGNLLRDVGKQADAEEQYRMVIAINEKMTVDYPNVPEYSSSLAMGNNNLGNLLSSLGKQVEAEEHYRKAMAIREKLATDFPTLPTYRSDNATSQYSLGNLLSSLGKQVEAEEHYRKAMAIREKLTADFPAVPDYRSSLAASHNSLGVLLTKMRKQVEAEEQYRKAIDFQQKLSVDFPSMLDHRSDLASSHNNLGVLLTKMRKQVEAEEQFRKAMVIREKMASDFPAVPDYQISLGGICCNFGDLLNDQDKTTESLGWYEKAIQVLMKVHDKQPQDATAKRFLRNSHYGRAKAYDALEKHPYAIPDWQRAIELTPAADQPEYEVEFGGSHCNFGIHLRDSGKPAESLEWYGKAVETLKPLHEQKPDEATAKRFLRNSYYGRSLAYDTLQRHPEAIPDWLRAIELTPAADQPEYEVEFGSSHCNFGNFYHRNGKLAESLEWYAKAILILKPIHDKDPQNVTAKESLRTSHTNRAKTFNKLKRYPEAIADWDRAIELSPPEEQPSYRAQRANTQTYAGQHELAVKEVVDLLKLADQKWFARDWYNFACIYAVAAGKTADRKQEYSDRAMDLLTKTVKNGYEDAAYLKHDMEIKPIRDRADFKKLLADLEAKFPIPLEVAPPPREAKRLN